MATTYTVRVAVPSGDDRFEARVAVSRKDGGALTEEDLALLRDAFPAVVETQPAVVKVPNRPAKKAPARPKRKAAKRTARR